MGQLLHGSARTTAAVRRAIQPSQESLAKLAARYDLNPKTIAKWKKRTYVHDAPMGPKQPHSTVLTADLLPLLPLPKVVLQARGHEDGKQCTQNPAYRGSTGSDKSGRKLGNPLESHVAPFRAATVSPSLCLSSLSSPPSSGSLVLAVPVPTSG
jgi:hypothetical protein